MMGNKNKPIPTNIIIGSNLKSGGSQGFDAILMSQINLILSSSHNGGMRDAGLQVIDSRKEGNHS